MNPGKMKKETQKKNMNSHQKGQRGGSSFELPVVNSSAKLLQSYKIKREDRMADLGQTKVRITEVEAPSIKPNHPPTNNQFKLSMFATTSKTNLNSNKEPEPKNKVSDNASRNQPKISSERSVEMEVSLKKHKGQSLVSKIQNSKGQSSAQGKGLTPTQIHDPKKQPMKTKMIEGVSVERQQTVKTNLVENASSKTKEQLQNKKVSENDKSREREQPRKRVVAQDESMVRNESGSKKTKRTPLCPSMSIDGFLKENGKDVNKEIQNLVEEEGDIVMEEQEENADSEEAAEANGTTKKKTRGPTRCLQIYGREYCEDITLDNEGEIIGPNDKTVTDVGNFLGTIARNSTLCPLIYTNFKDLLKEEEDNKTRKERLWRYINRRFNIADKGEKAVFSRINDAWRRHKSWIKKNHFLKYTTMKERLKNRPDCISECHFRKLLIYWKHNNVQTISKINAANRKKQKFMHRVGTTNFARIRAKLREKKGGEEVTKAEMFIETRKGRKGKELDGETQSAIDKLEESLKTSAEAGEQTFETLLGKERPGRVRCFGRTATPSLLKKNAEISLIKKQYDGQIAEMSHKMGAMESLLKNVYMQQNPHLSEEEVDNMLRNLLHKGDSPTPHSSTSNYAPTQQKVGNKDNDEDVDPQYDQDLQDDHDDDPQNELQDDAFDVDLLEEFDEE